MPERRLFIFKQSFKGNRSRKTGEFVARDLRQASRNPLWLPKEHPEHREPKAWEYSIYYWWWEFLRRHEGYKNCCERGGNGKYAKLYADWGDIHSLEYWDWWKQKVTDDDGNSWTRGEYLFAEPLRSIKVCDEITEMNDASHHSLKIIIPLEVATSDLVAMFRRLLNQHSHERQQARSASNALYPVASKVSLRSLYWALRAWDVEHATKDDCPKVKNHQKPQLMGILAWDLNEEVDRQRARMEFTRYYQAAEDYIACAAEHGTFPKRRAK